MRIYD